MKTDTYSKIVLTIIAVCLVILTMQQTNIIPKAHAADTSQSAFGNSGLQFDTYGNLKVVVENSYLKVQSY